MSQQDLNFIYGLTLKSMFISGANNLENNKNLVNSLNVFPVPDGDTGTNMSLTMNSAIQEMNNSHDDDIFAIVEGIANGSLMGARGNSGVILSQILRGFAKALKDEEKIDSIALANAFMEGSDTAYKAVMRPIEGTILTVIRESAEYGVKIARQDMEIVHFLEKVIIQANKTLEKTPDMLPALKQANVVDAGGKGLLYILNGMLYYITTNKIVELSEEPEVIDDKVEKVIHDDTEIKFGYCTEFFIKGSSLNPEKFKNMIIDMGDSLVVVGDDNLIKVHIHTDNPGLVIEKGLKLGVLSKIKIDNMREQHRELYLDKEDTIQDLKNYGIVAVVVGSGMSEIFKDLGTDEVIEGGQTMNPSTEDIIKSIEKINAENIIILPNNGNIILAANQAKSLSNKNILVAQTKTMPQGIAALMAIDQDKNPEENENKMQRAIEDVKTGLITYAVRDSNFDGVDIEEGNILGMVEGKISAVGENAFEIIDSIMDSMVDDDSSLITIYYGEEVDQEDAEAVANHLEEKFSDCDIEVHYGGQPLYYYIISVE